MSETTTSTKTTTTAQVAETLPPPPAPPPPPSSTTARPAGSELRVRKVPRRLSLSASASLTSCGSLPQSLEALDLTPATPSQALASLRFLVLSHLEDLERRITEVQPRTATFNTMVAQGEHTYEEAKQYAQTALQMLETIRADVCSHLPDVHLTDLSALEAFVKSHMPDFSDNFREMRAHLREMHMPQLPDMEEMRSQLSARFDDVRSRFDDLDFQSPFDYIPTLSDHLKNLHAHLSNTELPSGYSLAPSTMVFDLLDSFIHSQVVTDIIIATPRVIVEGEEMLERAATEVMIAVRKSFEGVQLIKYSDLPPQWRNNPFVTHGYRFIPLERWPLILKSLFAFHNETLNIHTHLVPGFLWLINLIPLFNSNRQYDLPEILFMSFALLCLLSSALWHTMSGCADHRSMEFCARVDYIGIGWLISASVGTVIHYGYQCHPDLRMGFLSLCLATGIAGNIFPFMNWFNQHKYRFYRIGFFLSLAFAGIAPMVMLSHLHSARETYDFVSVVFPSLGSYLMGLFFYACHFPECFLPESVRRKLDTVGGGSHAIWHCFIVLAVSQHKAAIQSMKGGLECRVPAQHW